MRAMRRVLHAVNDALNDSFEVVVGTFSALVVVALIIALAIRGGTP